jgi:hypothetical protein
LAGSDAGEGSGGPQNRTGVVFWWKRSSNCRPNATTFFVLHRFEDMPLDEVAAHLGIDQALAEARLAEALVRLCGVVDEAEARHSSERS